MLHFHEFVFYFSPPKVSKKERKNSFKKCAVGTMNRTHGNYPRTSNHFCRIKLIVSSYPGIPDKSCYKLKISTVADSVKSLTRSPKNYLLSHEEIMTIYFLGSLPAKQREEGTPDCRLLGSELKRK